MASPPPPDPSIPKAVWEWLRSSGWQVVEDIELEYRTGNRLTVTAVWKGETKSQRFIEVDGALHIEKEHT